MHERSQRFLCQLIFLIVCAFPTLGTLTIIAARHTSWYQRQQITALQYDLSQRCGLRVTVANMHHPSPGVMQIDGLMFADPETNIEIANVHSLMVAQLASHRIVQMEGVNVQSTHLPRAWELIHEKILGQPELSDSPIRFVVPRLTLRSPGGDYILHQVGGRIVPEEKRIRMRIQAFPDPQSFDMQRDPQSPNRPIQVDIVRDRRGVLPASSYELNTGDVWLPCNVGAPSFPPLRWIGKDAQFRGAMRIDSDASDWNLSLAGGASMRHVNVDQLIHHPAMNVATDAQLKIWRCQLGSSSIVFDGELSASAGVASGPLLSAVQQPGAFHLAPAMDPEQAQPDLYYRQLNLRLQCDGQHVTLGGLCDTKIPAAGTLPANTAMVGPGNMGNTADVPLAAGIRRMSIQELGSLLLAHRPMPEKVMWLVRWLGAS